MIRSGSCHNPETLGDQRFSGAVSGAKPWLYPQFMSLDTPLAAAVWQLLFLRALHVEYHGATLAITFLSVWTIYVGDHLLDVRRESVCSARHDFVLRHRTSFAAALAVCLASCLAMLVALPHSILFAGWALGTLVLLYLALIYGCEGFKRVVPKEVLVAVLFAAGTTLPVWSERHGVRHAVPALLLFLLLCLMNATAVDAQEWIYSGRRTRAPHRFTLRIARQSRWIACGIGVFAVLATAPFAPTLAVALLIGTFAQLAISESSKRFEPDTFRFLADVALVVPALLALL
jgi:hypothetical protein